jgi:hypothetical protein
MAARRTEAGFIDFSDGFHGGYFTFSFCVLCFSFSISL